MVNYTTKEFREQRVLELSRKKEALEQKLVEQEPASKIQLKWEIAKCDNDLKFWSSEEAVLGWWNTQQRSALPIGARNPSNVYCTYRSFNPVGKFYFGKGIVAKIEAGEYMGSGKDLWEAICDEALDANLIHRRTTSSSWLLPIAIFQLGWKCEVLEKYGSETLAYSAEKAIIKANRGNPLMLNKAGAKMPIRIGDLVFDSPNDCVAVLGNGKKGVRSPLRRDLTIDELRAWQAVGCPQIWRD